MIVDLFPINIILSGEFWLVFGVSLIVVEIAVGLEFFVLSFGAGAITTGLALIMGMLGEPIEDAFIGSPGSVLLFFAVTSLTFLVPIRAAIYFRSRDKPDINDY
jgi:membrane protein implicated in regulation of membrane protease activity